MPRPRKNTISLRDVAINTLKAELNAGRWPVGSKMPSLRALARRFGCSLCPVQAAVAALEEQGYVEQRHGSGTYVLPPPRAFRMADTAMLMTEVSGHVYGELTALLVNRLHDLGLFASTLDTAHEDVATLLRRASFSGARFLLTHAGQHFPFDALQPRSLDRKHLIAIIAWESDLFLDRVHRILVDHAAASRLLAEHLWEAGHRRVLLAGPDSMLRLANRWDGQGVCPTKYNLQGIAFAALWGRLGGRIATLEVQHEAPSVMAPAAVQRLCAPVDDPDSPTVVVGMRDVDAWDVRETLRSLRPETLDRLTFVGNGDTPWSQTSHPPFTTLNWNLDQIADLACGIIRDVEEGKPFDEPVVRLIPPRLVVR